MRKDARPVVWEDGEGDLPSYPIVWGLPPPRPCGPASTGLVVARSRRLRLLDRGRIGFASRLDNRIRPTPLGRPGCSGSGLAWFGGRGSDESYSTVTDLAKLRGWSTSQSRRRAT